MKMENNKTGFILGIFALCLCVSVISGIASGWYFGGRSGGGEIVVLDVIKIVEEKKKEFIEKYRDREPNPRMKEEMDREITSFVERLNQIIEEESKGKIVLTKDLVISNAKDITDEVSKRIKNPD